MGERIRVRNSQRLLQFFALALLALGTLNVLIQGGWAGKLVGVASLAAGISGVLGLSLSWHRALMSFTLLSWLVALSAFASLLRLALSRPIQTNPLPWVSWLANLLLALPAAVLASTMHILRVWKPSPMVTDTTAPLVESAADCEPVETTAVAAGAGAPQLAWPPPHYTPSVRSADVQTALRVGAAMHSGRGPSGLQGIVSASCATDVARHGLNSTAPTVPVWPPPPS